MAEKNSKEIKERADGIRENGVDVCSLNVFVDKGVVLVSCESSAFGTAIAAFVNGMDPMKLKKKYEDILSEAAEKLSVLFEKNAARMEKFSFNFPKKDNDE